MVRHTYLFEPAVWIASGTFWRGDGEPLEASGRTEVAHRPEAWLLSGVLRVTSSPPVEFVTAYRIQPPDRESGTMRWTSEDPTLGKVHGTYTVIASSIFSVYRCEDSGYHGAEHMGRMDPDCYTCAGLLLLDDRCLSSWQLIMRRQHWGPSEAAACP